MSRDGYTFLHLYRQKRVIMMYLFVLNKILKVITIPFVYRLDNEQMPNAHNVNRDEEGRISNARR